MARSEQMKLSPDSYSLISSGTRVCAVSLVPGNKWKVTCMTYFPSSWPPHAPAKIAAMVLLEVFQNFSSKYKFRETKNKQW